VAAIVAAAAGLAEAADVVAGAADVPEAAVEIADAVDVPAAGAEAAEDTKNSLPRIFTDHTLNQWDRVHAVLLTLANRFRSRLKALNSFRSVSKKFSRYRPFRQRSDPLRLQHPM
jgi:hypothetical protein